MNSLTQEIESVINNSIEKYIQCISSKYEEIDRIVLEEIWKDVSKSSNTSTRTRTSTRVPVKGKVITGKVIDPDGCPYIFIKGAKQDQKCGAKTKYENVYCSRHKKYEGTKIKERKSSPDINRRTVKPKNKTRSPVKPHHRVLRKNKNLDKLWHPETSLVFKSAKERTVIGKCVDDKLIPLLPEDIEECHKWGFSFLPIEDEGDSSSEDEVGCDSVDSVPSQNERSVYMEAPSASATGKKFWECKVSETSYTTSRGKVGRDGIKKEKTFESFALASNEMDKAIKTKTQKGYTTACKTATVETATVETATVDEESRDIFQTPSDIESCLDELQGDSSEHSDNSGMFIPNAIGLRRKTSSTDDEDEDDDDVMLIKEIDEEE
jgi:predicted DNA-binding WGR domain protein